MDFFNQIGSDLAHWGVPLFYATVLAATVASGVYWARCVSVWFFMRVLKNYHEREEVYLNGTSAVITKIGFLSTTFLILNGIGESGPVMRWACISNTELDKQRIERISLKPSKLKHSRVQPDGETK